MAVREMMVALRESEFGVRGLTDAQLPRMLGVEICSIGRTAARPLGRCRGRRIAVIRVVRVEGCHKLRREYHKSGLGGAGGGRWLPVAAGGWMFALVAVERKRWNGEVRPPGDGSRTGTRSSEMTTVPARWDNGTRAERRGGRARSPLRSAACRFPMMDVAAALPIWINGRILACHLAVLDLVPLDHLRPVRACVVSEAGSRTWSWRWGFGPFKGRTPAFGRKRKTPRWWPACHPTSRNEVEETCGARLETSVAGVVPLVRPPRQLRGRQVPTPAPASSATSGRS